MDFPCRSTNSSEKRYSQTCDHFSHSCGCTCNVCKPITLDEVVAVLPEFAQGAVQKCYIESPHSQHVFNAP